MSEIFYRELLQCSSVQARRIASFTKFASGQEVVTKANPWSKNGKVRVYFNLWSQNKLDAMTDWNTFYYDADKNDIVRQGFGYGKTYKSSMEDLKELSGGYSKSFSGAKTRVKIIEFVRSFYEQKDAWD